MNIIKNTVLFFGVSCFVSNHAFSNSHAHESCVMTSGDSCWRAYNSSTQSSNIYCEDSYKTVFEAHLLSKQNISYQYDMNWGSRIGHPELGYPEPGVVSNCFIEFSNGKKVNFKITSIAWGNQVYIRINESDITVSQKAPYPFGPQIENTYTTIL